MNIHEISELVKNIRKEQSLFSTIDINDLLKSFEKENHEYLENKSFKTIAEDIFNKLYSMKFIPENEIPLICDKLTDYFLIKNINEFRKSHYVRFIKKGESKLYTGGILVNVFSNQEGIFYAKFIIFGKRFINIKIDDHVFFQKLTADEKIILLSFDYLEQFNDNNH
jgi:hypothetical protein